MKNWVDAVFIIVAILAFIKGYKAGLLSTLFGVIGYIAGGLGGLALGIHYFHSHGVARFFLLFFSVAICSTIGEAILNRIGKAFHNRILFGPFKWLDSLLGAGFSILRALVGLLIFAHLLLITPWGDE